MVTLSCLIEILTLSNIESVFTILAGIATAVSAYLGLQALREVKKQRETTYHPEVVLGGGEFNIYNLPLTGIPFPPSIPWLYTYEDMGSGYHATEVSRIKPLAIRIHNIGLGAAKNVVVTCHTDSEEWLDIFNNFSSHIKEPLPFTITKAINENVLVFKSATFVGVGSRTLIFDKITKIYSHILPSSVDGKPSEFTLPYGIFYFLSAYTYLSFYAQVATKSDANARYNRPRLPKIHFSVKYLDIANKQINKKFIVRIKSESNTVSLVSGVTSKIYVDEVVTKE